MNLSRNIFEELRGYAKESKVACSLGIPKKPLIISTDPILLYIILQNIFSNAVKYSEGGCQIDVSSKKVKNHIEISIQDNGIGIPGKDQKRIFERLFRAHNAVLLDTDGNGLGLYIARMITEVIGGKISFKSIEGKGTKFILRLPLRPPKNPRHS